MSSDQIALTVYNADTNEPVMPQSSHRSYFIPVELSDGSDDRAHKPSPTNRFASPSCPWPWAGDDESDETRKGRETPPASRQQSPVRSGVDFAERDWRLYPGQFFPNWTPWVVKRCGMMAMFDQPQGLDCQVYVVNVSTGSRFKPVTTINRPTTRNLDPEPDLESFLKSHREDVTLRCICVENLSGDVLRILGAYYHIEPFYFSSAINRIPSRYYEDFDQRTRDHTYITLPFLRVKKSSVTGAQAAQVKEKKIDTFAPLTLLSSDQKTEFTLQQDMLAVLLVREPDQQTLVTIHPAGIEDSAKKLSKRIFMAGKGIYWGNLMRNTSEPLFVLLIVMWSVLYAWDEAMEVLYAHVLHLEANVLDLSSADLGLTRKLHDIRAHLLYYDELLEEFGRSVDFLQIVAVKEEAKKLLEKELKILQNEVDRLHRRRKMQDERLSNVMKLVLSVLNIQETRTSLQHSESMRQITYLTMIYLPASFIASIFGMNVKEIVDGTKGSLAHYFSVMVPLAAVTVWLAIGVSKRVEQPNGHMLWVVVWPLLSLWSLLPQSWKQGHGGTGQHERSSSQDMKLPDTNERTHEEASSRGGRSATPKSLDKTPSDGMPVVDNLSRERGNAGSTSLTVTPSGE